jgi:hypothetical protein
MFITPHILSQKWQMSDDLAIDYGVDTHEEKEYQHIIGNFMNK